jgi:Skp family chaperone for outer membrane proteins
LVFQIKTWKIAKTEILSSPCFGSASFCLPHVPSPMARRAIAKHWQAKAGKEAAAAKKAEREAKREAKQKAEEEKNKKKAERLAKKKAADEKRGRSEARLELAPRPVWRRKIQKQMAYYKKKWLGLEALKPVELRRRFEDRNKPELF